MLVVSGLWLLPIEARAQCTKDTDCKGDRICEEGKCTSPTPPPAPPEAPPEVAAEPPPLAPAPAEASPPAEPSPVARDLAGDEAAVMAELGPQEPSTRPRSKAALTTGIVMVSVAPIALLGALAASNAQERCDDELQAQYPGRILPTSEQYRAERCDGYSLPLYLLGIGGAVLGAVGIPLLIYGAPRVPTDSGARVQVTPWANTQAGGVRLRLAL